MSPRLTHRPFRLALLCLLTLALLATGFAHRAPSDREAALQATWMMAGGSWSGICGGVTAEGQPAHVKCPACQLTGAAALPPAPATVEDATPRLLTTLAAAPATAPVHAAPGPALGSRAPPAA